MQISENCAFILLMLAALIELNSLEKLVDEFVTLFKTGGDGWLELGKGEREGLVESIAGMCAGRWPWQIGKAGGLAGWWRQTEQV